MGRVVQPNNYFSQEDSIRGQFNTNSSLSSQTYEDVWSGNFLTGGQISGQNNNSLSSNRTYEDVWSGNFLTGGSSNGQDFNGGWSGDSFLNGGSSSNTSSRTTSSTSSQQVSTSRHSIQHTAGQSSR